jgi:hypothetical protein
MRFGLIAIGGYSAMSNVAEALSENGVTLFGTVSSIELQMPSHGARSFAPNRRQA